jgi:hypothetical protein
MTTTNDSLPLGFATQAADLALRLSEVMVASGVVVAARMSVMGAAMLNPLEGDYKELGRMVPEKVAALSHSGLALLTGVGTMQRDLAAQAMDMALMMMGGVSSAKTLGQWTRAANARGTRAMLWPMTAGAAAIGPVHRTVTANARRLGA